MGAPRFANRICGWPGFAALCWTRANILYSFLCLSKWNFRVFPVIAEIYIADINCNKLYLIDYWLWKKSFELIADSLCQEYVSLELENELRVAAEPCLSLTGMASTVKEGEAC